MEKQNKKEIKAQNFNIIVARNVAKNSTKKGDTVKGYQVSWEYKKSHDKFRNELGQFDFEENWILI